MSASKMAECVMRITGAKWGGHHAPPLGDSRTLYVEEPSDGVTRVISTIDDGGFVGIGYPDKWDAIMRTHTARLFALWVLRQWVADWFGLRSAVYYRALNRKCSGTWGRLGKPAKAFARATTHDAWCAERERSRA